jgi:predicted metal-dependent hydrolase
MLRRALTSDNPIIIGDFTVLVKPVARARNLTLRYNLKKSCFVVSGPKRASRKSLTEFVAAHHTWMQQQIRSIPKAPSIIEDGFITIEGIPRKIIHSEATGVHVSLLADTVMVACRAERLPRALQRFIVQHAEKLISELAHEKAERIGKRITKITLRDTSSRWGSCASDGSLSFSWRLIMAPFDVIDYVVAHEVAHLQHFDHSPDFWALCRELSENYTMSKHWLKLNGAQLQATSLA